MSLVVRDLNRLPSWPWQVHVAPEVECLAVRLYWRRVAKEGEEEEEGEESEKNRKQVGSLIDAIPNLNCFQTGCSRVVHCVDCLAIRYTRREIRDVT